MQKATAESDRRKRPQKATAESDRRKLPLHHIYCTRNPAAFFEVI